MPKLDTSKAGKIRAITVLFLFPGGNYEKAIECTKTYLLFFPNDEVMNQNLAYYTAVLGEDLARPIEPREVGDQLGRDSVGTGSVLLGLTAFAEVSQSALGGLAVGVVTLHQQGGEERMDERPAGLRPKRRV